MTETKQPAQMNTLEAVAEQYGWKVEAGNLYNSIGKLVSTITTKRGRILIHDNAGNLRGSLGEPAGLGKYLEQVYYAKRQPVKGARIMTPTAHEKSEWQRMARAAYSIGKNAVGHQFSTAASLADNEALPLNRFDDLQDKYRAWLCFGEWPAE